MSPSRTLLLQTIQNQRPAILQQWMAAQQFASARGVITEQELQQQCIDFLTRLETALQDESATTLDSPALEEVKETLREISRSRGLQGFSPSETAMFILGLKTALIQALQQDDAEGTSLITNVVALNNVLDQLGLYTTEIYQKMREDVIHRQGQELLELTTPVVKLWDGILALPLIGTLDSSRTQQVMESLLQRIVETGSDVAIIDITGVPMVDTLVAQHLLKTVTAARLMGAECIISGVRPQIAQTIVHLGVDLGDIVTKASLADAFRVAMKRNGLTIIRDEAETLTKR
jgi:rsbT co-antagonist protein RsbR